MKRLIPTLTLIIFLIISCDTPVNEINSSSKSPESISNNQLTPLLEMPKAKADSIRKVLVNQFQKNYGKEWQVSWNKKTGTPLSVFSGTTEPLSGSPEQVARSFLSKNRSLFNMKADLSDLKLREIITSKYGVQHVRFQQMYKGIPVHDATYQVHIRPDGKISMANGHYYPNIEASTQSGISASSAKQAAINDIEGKVNLKKGVAELVLFKNPEYEKFSLAWRIRLRTGSPNSGYWQYFIDAGNGVIIKKSDLATTITGDGDIIEDNPNLTPNTVNKNFYRLDGNGYLKGTFANVHNDEMSRAYSSNNSFVYTTNNSHFDEANVYYHIDLFRYDYLNTIGFAGEYIGSDQDLEAWVHDQDSPSDAKYIGGSGYEEVRFGDAVGFAKADKIIYHEFVHAVIDAENGSYVYDPNPSEEGAIGEGISDYFAGSYTNRTKIGTTVLVSTKVRDMTDPDISTYSQYLTQKSQPISGEVEEHLGGEFFSAILWDLRSQMSNQTADEIIFEAISETSSSPNFLEYRNAMMDVDDLVNNGANNDLIQNTFAEYGIGDYVPPSITISGQAGMFQGESQTFTTSVDGDFPPYNYQWYYKGPNDTYWNLLSGETSSSYYHTAGSGPTEKVKVIVYDDNNNSGEDQFTISVAGGWN